jgi:hypothetical protein
MYVCIRTYVYTHIIRIHTYVCMYACTYVSMHVCMHAYIVHPYMRHEFVGQVICTLLYVHVSMHVCMHANIVHIYNVLLSPRDVYVCMYVCTYVRIHTYVYTYVHTHTHTQTHMHTQNAHAHAGQQHPRKWGEWEGGKGMRPAQCSRQGHASACPLYSSYFFFTRAGGVTIVTLLHVRFDLFQGALP